MTSTMDQADNVPTPRSQNLSNGAFEAAAASESTFKGRVAFSSETSNTEKEDNDDNMIQEISNPQDATLRKSENAGEQYDKEDVENNNGINQTKRAPKPSKKTEKRRMRNRNRLSNKPKKSEFIKRKRGRVVRVATIEDSKKNEASAKPNLPPLPGNQYRCTLRRRAIRKLEEGTTIEEGADPEDYGDISLGMKLIVAGGRVIVQTLNALSDGRASPAQLAALIQRGDVLLAIGNVSLVNLPVDQLLEGLKPLSAPGPTGSYKRILDLRFESGVGMGLLKTHEETQSWKNTEGSPTARRESEVFSLFPMVDQLSGAPLFDDHKYEKHDKPDNHSEMELEGHGLGTLNECSEESSEGDEDEDSELALQIEETKEEESPDDLISKILASQQKLDRLRFTSDFFYWREGLSELLRKAVRIVEKAEEERCCAGMTQTERVELGKKVMNLARSLAVNIEELDKGKNMRCFKTWSTNFSVRSGASARRRYILDSASLKSYQHHNDSEISIDGSDGSESGSLDEVDGDALLLGLAAHDGIWRKQVIEALQESISEMEKQSDDDEERGGEEEPEVASDIDDALTKELGSFLFGKQMSLIVSKKKKTFVLPPKEVTTVLFDLTTNIATSAPDEITLFGQTSKALSFQSGTTGTQGKSKSALKADYILANVFILEEALPVWLKSFRPFSLDQRRVLWPRIHHSSTASHAGTNSDADSLTVDSVGSATRSPSRPKDLREIIEDQELDVETRAETCFLVTYYFTQQILAKYSGTENQTSEEERALIDEEATSFVKRYGAYLQIRSCLSYAAAVKAESPIDDLLVVASHDLSHRDAVKEIQKGKALTFYDTTKLSAVLKFLGSVRYELKEDRRTLLKNLCVSAYPDVQPWQVRTACIARSPPKTSSQTETRTSCGQECLKSFYYGYLSLLLDPVEGHETARHDSNLVKEWCKWSIGMDDKSNVKPENPEYLQNFFRVASRASSDHLVYHRDLIMLLDMSMLIDERDLALDLAGEILESRRLLSDPENPKLVLSCLRKIGMGALTLAQNSEKEVSRFRILKRVLRLFHQMSTSDSPHCSSSITVADELYTFMQEWKTLTGSNGDDLIMLNLIDFIVNGSAPGDVLRALVLWSSSNEVGNSLYPRLDTLLRRGVQAALKSELSGSLLRLKHARLNYTDENRPALSAELSQVAKTTSGIWRQMAVGDLSVDK